jgi:hypothetical protein
VTLSSCDTARPGFTDQDPQVYHATSFTSRQNTSLPRRHVRNDAVAAEPIEPLAKWCCIERREFRLTARAWYRVNSSARDTLLPSACTTHASMKRSTVPGSVVLALVLPRSGAARWIGR